MAEEEGQVHDEGQGEQVVEEAEPQQPPQPDPDTEKRAKLMGWVPKESFRGDPSKWRPADEFVSRAEELMPIMKTQLRKYEDTISGLQTELHGTRQTVEKIVKMSEKANQMAYERAVSDLTARQMQAVASGDTQAWMALETEKAKIQKPEPIQVEQPRQQNVNNEENPLFKTWHKDNEWYLADPVMTRYANAYAQEHQNPNIPYMTWLDAVAEAVKEAFPHKFQNPNRAKPASVDGGSQRGGAGPGRPKAKSYNDLPADAKMQCDKYVNQKLMTKEKYVQEYFAEV